MPRQDKPESFTSWGSIERLQTLVTLLVLFPWHYLLAVTQAGPTFEKEGCVQNVCLIKS